MSAPNVEQLVGPGVVGIFLNWGLFGCVTVQIYYYYCLFPKDNRGLKTLVYFLYLWDVAQICLSTDFWFDRLAKNFDNLPALDNIGASWFAVPVMSGITSGTVQIFYALRVHRLSGSYILPISIVLIALMEASAAVAVGILSASLSVVELQEKTFGVTSVWLLGSAICDIVICASMLFYLHRARSETSIKATETLLTRLIRLSVGAGFFTAVVAIVAGVFFLAFPHNNYHLGPSSMLQGLYTNSFMVLLNSRRPQRDMDGDTAYLWFRDSHSLQNRSQPSSRPVAVEVNVERQSAQDSVMMVDLTSAKGKDARPSHSYKMGEE